MISTDRSNYRPRRKNACIEPSRITSWDSLLAKRILVLEWRACQDAIHLCYHWWIRCFQIQIGVHW